MHPLPKHLADRGELLGLELVDLFVVVVVVGAVLMFTASLLATLFTAGAAYGAVFAVKRGRPTGWTRQWVEFQVRPQTYCGGPAWR